MAVRVHNAGGYLKLLGEAEWADNERSIQNFSPTSTVHSPQNASPRLTKEEQYMISLKQRNHEREERNNEEWTRAKAAAKLRLQKAAAREEAGLEQRYQELMQTRNGYMNELQERIQDVDYRHARKREMLHAQWLDNVFNPVQNQISAKLDAQWQDISADNLKHTKTILSLKTNPLNQSVGRNHTLPRVRQEHCKIKYSTAGIQDPLKPQPPIVMPEAKKQSGPPSPRLGAARIEPSTWSHYSRVHGHWERRNIELQENRELLDACFVASDPGIFSLDHYGYATGERGAEIVRKEFGTSKKIVAPMSKDGVEHKPKGKKPVDGAINDTRGLLV
uniref:Uncharacterized protein n=1 Tax=Eutreptiella gymnastica TaxID=73025 RepID=A0A7S1IPJ5_9EUGL|mmetsp:Transcript_32854/g.58903  ORF Transcript_32854/g.58903 Transcript_32854/m.58903 type:complete len:333 (+) Transcript_32854:81-1079(+)